MRIGEAAEHCVRRILAQLPRMKWRVFHDLTAKYGNIDHLVVSCEGTVFLLETKGHRGTASFNGKALLLNGRPFPRDPIAQINRNIRWVKDLVRRELKTDPWIVAAIVLTDARLRSSEGRTPLRRQPVKRISIIPREYLKSFLRSYSPKKTAPEIWNRAEEVFNQAIK